MIDCADPTMSPPRKPDDFDFACSPDWRAAYDQSTGLRPIAACKTLREARFNDDMQSVRQARNEMVEIDPNDYDEHRKLHHELWKAVEAIQKTINELRREQQCLDSKITQLINKQSQTRSAPKKSDIKVDL